MKTESVIPKGALSALNPWSIPLAARLKLLAKCFIAGVLVSGAIMVSFSYWYWLATHTSAPWQLKTPGGSIGIRI